MISYIYAYTSVYTLHTCTYLLCLFLQQIEQQPREVLHREVDHELRQLRSRIDRERHRRLSHSTSTAIDKVTITITMFIIILMVIMMTDALMSIAVS